MGLTLIAVLTAALLLPGIIAARSFYHAGHTNEVEPALPPLSSVDGIALIGLFSVVVHLLYAVGLKVAVTIPALAMFEGVPIADPYAPMGSGHADLNAALSVLLGLAGLCLLALPVGNLAGRLMMRSDDKTIFYGSMAEILAKTGSDDDFVVAYVLTKIEQEGRLIGYEGTVVSLLRDADRFPAKVILKDASIFYLTMADERPVRRETAGTIDWIALAAEDWYNIAFKVFKVVDDPVDATAASSVPVADAAPTV